MHEKREQERAREEQLAEAERHRETRELLKRCEEKCTQLYQEVINQSKTGVERWTDIQRRYEDSQALLQRQTQINEDLQAKLAQYKSLNQQLEYSWQHKLEQAQLEREVIIDTLKAGSERALAVIKGDNDKRVAELQA